MKRKRGYAQICEMETGIVVDTSYYRLHLIIRKLRELGYTTFTEYYMKICEN